MIALRSALRTLPLAIDPESWKDGVPVARSTLAVFRALAVSWAAARIPADDAERRTAARLAAARSASSAYFPTNRYAGDSARLAAASSARYADSSARSAALSARSATLSARSAALSARSASRSAVWAVVASDCAMLAEGVSAQRLLRTNIWAGAPKWFREARSRARKWLVSGLEEIWPIWSDWYEARMRGEEFAFPRFNAKADREFSDWLFALYDEWWDRDAADVNHDIAEKVKDLTLAKPPTDAELRQEQSVVNYTIDEDGVTQIAPEPLPNGIQDDQDTQDNYGEIGRLIEEALLECDPNRTQDKAMGPATNLLKEGMGAKISEIRPRLFILRAKEVVRRFEDREAGNALTPLSQGQADAFAPLVDALKTLAKFDPKLNELWVGRKDGEAGLTKEQLELVVMALADVRQMSPDAQQTAETYVAQVDDDAAPDDPALKQANDGIGNAVKAMGKAAKKTDEALKTTDRAIRVAEKGGKMWDKLHDKLPSGDTVSKILEWLNNLPGGGSG